MYWRVDTDQKNEGGQSIHPGQYFGFVVAFRNETTGKFHPAAFSAGEAGLIGTASKPAVNASTLAIPTNGFEMDQFHGDGFAANEEAKAAVMKLNEGEVGLHLPADLLFLDHPIDLRWDGTNFPLELLEPKTLTFEGIREAVDNELRRLCVNPSHGGPAQAVAAPGG